MHHDGSIFVRLRAIVKLFLGPTANDNLLTDGLRELVHLLGFLVSVLEKLLVTIGICFITSVSKVANCLGRTIGRRNELLEIGCNDPVLTSIRH